MTVFPSDRIGEILQKIYDSEINVQITSEWDAGFNFRIGDEMNGWEDHSRVDYTIADHTKLEQVVSALAFCVAAIYPDAKFSKWVRKETYILTSI